MQYAVWIALAVVFIAIAPSLFKRRKGGDQSGRPGGEAGADRGDDSGSD